MKKSRLFIAAIALMGIAACAKMETPTAQEEPEVIAPEQTVAAESEQTADVKSVAAVLNDVAQKNQVKLFINNLMIMIGEGSDARHFDFDVAISDEEATHSYICGSLGLDVGEYHPIAIDMDLMVLEMFPIVGQLDMVQISKNYAKASLCLDNISCDYYLGKASLGFGLTINGSMKLCLLRGTDEKGKRTIGLYLIDPEDPSIPPFPLGALFSILVPKG